MKLLSLLPYFVLVLKAEAHPYSNGGDSNQHVMSPSFSLSDSSYGASDTTKVLNSPTSWNLARLCQPKPLIEDNENNDTTKNWPGCLKPGLGSGVLVYVLDNGVDGTHSALAGRVKAGRHMFLPDQPGNTETTDPLNKAPSHGTQVAAVVAGTGVGVAPAATIIPFNVFNPAEHRTTEEGFRLALGMAVSDFRKQRETNSEVQAVINISAESANDAGGLLANAIGEGLDLGMHVVISAGNENKDMCDDWVSAHPAARNVITVGGTNIKDLRLYFPASPPEFPEQGSNFGECVDLYAPGENVNTVATTQNEHEFVDGTSFSAPLVSGIIAALLSEGIHLTPAEMKKKILGLAQTIRIPNIPKGTKTKPLAQFDSTMKV
ncbi:peptidase S8/S53 domain-containing protein [Flagelloscypha sp. PMI_526]|nr:peptidase S8/S53 domain-containing protein [Flagelloscypha sp. PMI_526]